MKKTNIFLLALFFSSFSFAQVPSTVSAADGEAFPDTQICTEVEFQNSGSPGYGPYLQLTVPVGLSYANTELFGLPVPTTNVGVFPPAPGNQLTDPVTGQTVTGNPGDGFYIIQPQIGSVVSGGPPLVFSVCLDIDPTAPVNNPLPVSVTPVYEFGDTPTGDNGPIVGGTDDFDITPVLVTFEKTNSAPEDERPPGPSWPVTYTLNVDVANNNTLDNIDINDVLPGSFVLNAGSINITGGTNCVANLPNINVTCDSITGTASDTDLEITYSGYFDDVLDETTCQKDQAINNATFDADFDDGSGSAPVPQLTDSNTIQLEHMSIQKGASPGEVVPGNTVTYDLNVQLSDYGNADRVIVTDILPDGVTFNSVLSGGVTPSVTVNSPSIGQTTLVFDVTAALGTVGSGTGLNISYDATVEQTYVATGDSVVASDPLTNAVAMDYDLVEGANACGDGSAASVVVAPVVISKEVITTGPYVPGDTVTYRLSLEVPSGDTNGVVFEDFFPLPVFDVTDVDLTFGNDITLSPLDSLGLTPTSITVDAPTNSLKIEWPDIATTSAQTLSVDVDISITDDPFADNLSLANLLQVSTENTIAEVATGITPVLVQVRAPQLRITKGVLSSDQGTITPPPSNLPVDGNVTGVDSFDDIEYQFTVENIGGAPAYDVVITDQSPDGIIACTIGSVTDGDGATLTYTSSIVAGVTLIALDNPLAENDGSMGVPYSTDTALITVECTVNSNSVIGSDLLNIATAEYASLSGAVSFPPVSDDANARVLSPSIDKTILGITPNVDGVNNTITIGEVIEYQVEVSLPEVIATNAVITDQLDNGLVFLSFDSINASADVTTSVAGGFAGVLSNAIGLNTGAAFFDFGTLVNNNADNSTDETITITYSVLVDDVPANQDGNNKNNAVNFSSDETSISDSAPNRRVREPALALNKTVNPANADAGDTVAYTLIMSNTGNSPAFDVVISDSLSDPDLILVAGSVVTSSGVVTTGNTVGDTAVQVDVPSVAISGNVTVTFDVLIDPLTVSGSVLNNVASTIGDTLPGNDPNERDYGPIEDDADVNIAPAEVVKSVLPATSNEQSEGVSGQGNSGLVDLTLGEEVTFNIVATLAEGVSPSVIITDTLPDNAGGQMNVVSAQLISVGANLTPTNPAPPANIGPANVVSFDFGSVTNTPDGTVDANDQIVVQVTAVVTSDAVNSGVEVLTNNVLIQYDTGLNVSGSADIEVVEPLLNVDKTGSVNSADAGDTISYSITIDNTSPPSSARAFEATLSDAIPAGLSFAGNLQVVSGLAPDTGPTESAGSITASWNEFPLGQSVTISYDVTVDTTVAPEQIITNTANIAWTSMPGANANERTGTDAETHTVTITASGLTKAVVSTSESSTDTSENGPEDDLTIGEIVTYRMNIVLPEATSNNAMMTDQLPNTTAKFDVVSSQIVSIGANLTVPGANAGDAGAATDTNADTYLDLITWNLGNVVNAPDGVSNGDDEIVFEVVAVVVDDAVNQTNLNDVVNNATFSADGSSVTDSALVDIVEPIVAVSKTTLPASITADAGDVLTYQLTVAHQANSSADAFNLIVEDNLPVPGTDWINNSTVASTCPGLSVDSTAEPMIEFSFDALALATGSCVISYDVQVDNTVNPTVTYANTANLSYTSTSVIIAGQTRTSTDMDQTDFITASPAVVKVSAASSLSDTGDNEGNPLLPDLAIGEEIDFTLTIIVPEGITTNAVVTDQLPIAAGMMEVLSATVDTTGGNISTTLTGAPVISDSNTDTIDDRVVFDFGDITNVPDGTVDAGDQISMTVTARLLDDAANMAIDVLTNNVAFSYDTGVPLTDDADVEVVEPNLGLAKSFGAVNDYVVPITLTMNNTGGSASAYDLVVDDVFDTNVWDVGGFSAVTIPTGFVLTTVPGPGANQTTVRISSDGNFGPPDSSLEMNEVVSFVFNATLRSDVPIPTTLLNNASITEASSLPGADPEERTYGPVDANDTLLLPALNSDKAVSLNADSNGSGGASPGETLNYSISVVNSGDAPATSVVVTDLPDPNGSLVVGSVTTDVGLVTTGNTAGDASVAVNVGTLNNGATVTITYQVTINNPLATGVEQLVNQAEITTQEVPDFDSNDPSTAPDDDPTVIPVDAAPDLVVVKDDGGTTTTPGGTVIYILGYSNVGSQDSTGVEITETVPANSNFDAGNSDAGWNCLPNGNAGSACTIGIGAVAAGDPVDTVNFAVTVDDPLASGVTELNNTVSIADDGNNGTDLTPGDNDDSDNTPITAAPDLQVSKDDGGVTVQPDDVIAYTLNYANVGNQDATGVVITETVPTNSTFVPGSSSAAWSCLPNNNAGGTCTVNLATLAAGDNGSLTFAVQVDDPLAAGIDAINNGVSIGDDGSNGMDPTPGDNSDTDDTPVTAAPDLILTKTDGVTLASPGDTLVYALTYQNVGDQNATGVVISETVPMHTTFNATSSSAGWSCANGAPAGSNCQLSRGSIMAGAAAVSVQFAVNVDDPLAAGATSVNNAASVADDGANGPDPTPGNNNDIDVDSLTGTALDLAVSKDDGGITTIPGDVVIYTIDYDNLGNIGATGVELTETVPLNSTFAAGSSTAGWSCTPNNNAGSTCLFTVGLLNGGDSASVNFAVTVDDPLAAGVDTLSNTVSISDDGTNGEDIDSSNDSDSDTTPVTAAPDLAVTKVDQQPTVNAGDALVYDISYENIGDQDATGVVITEAVPLFTTFNAAGSSAGWNCSPNGNAGSACTLALGSVNAGDAAQTVQFAVLVDAALPDGVDTLNNTVSINDDGNNGPDSDPSNNNDTEPTDVVAAPDLVITKSDGGMSSGPGQAIVYTLTYENIGSQDSVGVVVTETIPANTTFNAGISDPAWSCSGTTPGNSCTYFIGNVNVGDNGAVIFAVDVDDPLPQNVTEIVNNANIADDGTNGPDEDLSNNDDTETTSLFLNPPVGVKTVEVDASDPRLLHWTFYWYNPNNNVDLPVFIYDDIPAGTTYTGTSSCTADGTSTCMQPIYNSGLNRIELTAVISPDPGAPANTPATALNHEVLIEFDTRITAGGVITIENQANANWDENNNGDANDDAQSGQDPVVTDDPTTTDINDPTEVRAALPIPTLSTWALLLLMSLSLLIAVPAIRSQRLRM